MTPTTTPNRELVVLGLYLAGGASQRIHTEEVAIQCWKKWPESFSWRTHPEYPDKDIVRVALFDAQKEKYGAFVSGRMEGKSTSDRDVAEGWLLTERGLRWVKEHENRVSPESEGQTRKTHRQQLLRTIAEFRSKPLFGEYMAGPESFQPGIGQLAAYFRCRVDANPSVWEKRFNELQLLSIDANDGPLSAFVLACKAAYQRER